MHRSLYIRNSLMNLIQKNKNISRQEDSSGALALPTVEYNRFFGDILNKFD